MEFPEGWGVLKKYLPWGRHGYFLELHNTAKFLTLSLEERKNYKCNKATKCVKINSLTLKIFSILLCLCRHEEQQHDQKLDADETPLEENKADHKFNYHSAKLAFGLVLFEFKDAVKEGDGDRLFDTYKLALLLYKNHGHYKYAYAVLLYLVKCIAILPPSQALQLKWNRTYNISGLPGRNISLDLQKEHDNKDKVYVVQSWSQP